MMVDRVELERRIMRGATLLDEKCPGWAGKINLSQLNIARADDCVLGQCFGGYDAGLREIGAWNPDDRMSHGFTVNFIDWSGEGSAESVANNLWRAEIEDRLSGHGTDAAEPRIVALEDEVARLREIVEKATQDGHEIGDDIDPDSLRRSAPMADSSEYEFLGVNYIDSGKWAFFSDPPVFASAGSMDAAIQKALNAAFEAGAEAEAEARAALYNKVHAR